MTIAGRARAAAVVALVLGAGLGALLAGTGGGVSTPVPPVPTGLTLSAYPTYGVAPLLVAFNATPPNGTPPEISWSFGDGQYLNGTGSSYLSPSHDYIAPGSYTAKVVATWGAQSLNATVTVVAVGDDLSARIVATPLEGLAPLTVRFNGTATGGEAPYTAYLWSFGDGDVGSGPTVRYTYLSPGPFVAVLTVNDSAGHSASASVNVTVVTTRLNVSIVANPATGGVPLTVHFQGVATGGSLTYLSYNWTFGDGTAGAGPSIQHTYAAPGRFVVHVSVTDSLGGVAATSAVIVVSEPSFSVSITADMTAGRAPLPVHFTAGTVGGATPFVAFDWSFGDGDYGSGLSVNHTFVSAGTYRVSLTVEDAWQTNVSSSVQVTVSAANVTVPTGPGPKAGLHSASTGGPSFFGISVLALALVGVGIAALGITATWVFLSRRRQPRLGEAGSSAIPPAGPNPDPDGGPPPNATPEIESTPPEATGTSPEVVGAAAAVSVAGPAVDSPDGDSRTFAGQRQVALRVIARLANLPRLGPDDLPTAAWTQAGLADALHVGKSAVSKVLRRLIAAGIVEGEAVHVAGSARRTRAYRLTARGERLGRSLPDPVDGRRARSDRTASEADSGTGVEARGASTRAARGPFVSPGGSSSDAE